MTNEKITRSYKDSLFRMVFREKKELLDLYNAINGTDYNDPDALIPVFRRSTRNVPKFWIYPSPTCFIYDLSNADYSWKNCCPFRAFFY